MSSLSVGQLFSVKGYVAAVTGGSSGLGFMISKVYCERPAWDIICFDLTWQGLVVNGAKVYVIALPTEPIDEKVAELNELGLSTGGSAHG